MTAASRTAGYFERIPHGFYVGPGDRLMPNHLFPAGEKESDMTTVIRPEAWGVKRVPISVGQIWTVDGTQHVRWFVLTPGRVIALFAGGADHTPASLVHTYGDRLRLEQTATVYADGEATAGPPASGCSRVGPCGSTSPGGLACTMPVGHKEPWHGADGRTWDSTTAVSPM